MSDSGRQLPHDGNPAKVEATIRARIERAVARARLVLIWEDLWPRIAPFIVIAAVFAILSWFGLWRVTSDVVRIAVLVVLLGATIYAVWRAVGLRRPGRSEAMARVEQATGVLHRPATAFTDKLATGADDPTARALWAAHRTRLLAALNALKTGLPAPGLARRDPYAVRFLVAILFVVAFIFAGAERLDKLNEAFRGGEPVAATIARIDAWVTPPAYTSRAPIFLTGEAAKPSGTEYSVPTGSIVTVRTGGTRDLDVVSADGATETPAEVAEATTALRASATGADADEPLERQVKLSRPATVIIRKGGTEVASWRFVVEPDSSPQVSFLKPPGATVSGALSLTYSLKDDYGVVVGTAEVAPAEKADPKTAARPLFEAPSIPLSLPQVRTREGNGETIRDLTSHPWAGSKVLMTLVARDEAEQEGRSQPVEVTLPARRFVDPLARAIVEQRAKLAQDANAAGDVGDALDTLTLAPEKTIEDVGDYLAIRSAYHRMLQARSDDDLRGVVDYLWSIALGIEDGDLSLAAQELRAAQEALRQALEDGASDEEIERLTAELREAMQKFLQALAEEARKNPQMSRLPPDADMRTLRSDDLERMLDQIEQLAKNGARDAARQLLSELQNMLENLQAGQPMMGDQQSAEMMEMMNELGEMIRRQQQLMDQTHRLERGQDPSTGQPMTKEQLEQALRQLEQQQGDLQQALKDLMAQMEGMGMDPNGKLGQADGAMGRAGESLGKGQAGRAVGDQGEALEALRQGAQGMAQQFANRGQGNGNGFRNGDQFPNEDPLGRPQRTTGPDLGTTVKVPDEIDIQRAREILEAIRKRLSDPGRGVVERDYLERLLDRF
jgi:uncharacterized protein (TIGR02302 family)